jgi:hypothetical protein
MRIRLAIALLAAGLALGCFAVDEIDKGMNDYEHHSGAQAAHAAPSPEPAAAQGANGTAAKRPNPWLGAHSLTSEPMRAQVVGCKLAGSTQFMTEDDCRARGGKRRP